MAKKLVVYYSKTGNTKIVAETIAKQTKADIEELKWKKEIKSKGFMRYFLGGYNSKLRRKIKIQPLEKNPEDYDTIYIGTPIWAGNMNPAIRTFLKNHQLQNKKVALFCTCAGEGGKNLDELKGMMEGNEIIGDKIFMRSDKTSEEEKVKEAENWIKEIK
ncbi:MAG: flavodoxin family protein [Candidatus Heimdallarchaeota archaeon]